MSCTESLGCESSDTNMDELMLLCSSSRKEPIKLLDVNKEDVKKFPPPLPSLNQHGRPTFFLRPVRVDGRLMLTEVKIGRPEILRADRTDGRLRLHLIRDQDEHVQEEEIVEEELDGVEGWQLPANGRDGGGDGFRRCHDQVNHHPHHQHVWRQNFLTIR